MSRHRVIEDQAIDWLIQRDEPTWSDANQAELDNWLRISMANRAAYLRAQHGWAEADRVRSLGEWDHDDSVYLRHRRAWWQTAIAASLVATFGIGVYLLIPHFSAQSPAQETRFATAVGGHKIIALADGSEVELNTRTRMRALVDKKRRDVWLDSGEAYFEVKHRDGELFVVHAGNRTITDLGTKFSVRVDGERVTVNVIEGRVQVDSGEGRDASAAILSAGSTAYARSGSTMIAPKSDERVENAIAWRDGMLTFNLSPLSEVASEFNRYNRAQLTVDPSAAEITIGGTFQASNVGGFTRLLHDVYGLKTEENGNQVRISN